MIHFEGGWPPSAALRRLWNVFGRYRGFAVGTRCKIKEAVIAEIPAEMTKTAIFKLIPAQREVQPHSPYLFVRKIPHVIKWRADP